jgi:aspartate ammonia-lyase
MFSRCDPDCSFLFKLALEIGFFCILMPYFSLPLGSMAARKNGVRVEFDQLGQIQLPAWAYWGAATVRATEGRSVSGMTVSARLVSSIALICRSSVLSLCEAGLLELRIAQAVSQAADEILSGQWSDQFIVDSLQPDLARALVINVAEVLANRACETLGGNVGAYEIVCINKHILLGLTEEDVFCCALRIATLSALTELEPCLLDTERLLRRKALELDAKTFNGYGSSVQRTHKRLGETAAALLELNLLRLTDAELPSTLATRTIERIAELTGMKYRLADECLRGGHISADFVGLSGCVRELFLVIARIASDLRNRSGSYAIADAVADAVIAGSYQVCGADTSVAMCAQDSALPVQMFANIAYSLLQNVEMTVRCVRLFNKEFLSALSCKAASQAVPGVPAVNVCTSMTL